MDESWRVLLALSATAAVAVGAYLMIRFITGYHW